MAFLFDRLFGSNLALSGEGARAKAERNWNARTGKNAESGKNRPKPR
jgi:hypothetical protein